MQRTDTLLPPHHADALDFVKSFIRSLRTLTARSLFVGCRHARLSRPFTREGRTYRVCIKCGMRRDFDLRNWKTYGPYYKDELCAGRFGSD